MITVSMSEDGPEVELMEELVAACPAINGMGDGAAIGPDANGLKRFPSGCGTTHMHTLITLPMQHSGGTFTVTAATVTTGSRRRQERLRPIVLELAKLP